MLGENSTSIAQIDRHSRGRRANAKRIETTVCSGRASQWDCRSLLSNEENSFRGAGPTSTLLRVAFGIRFFKLVNLFLEELHNQRRGFTGQFVAARMNAGNDRRACFGWIERAPFLFAP